MTIAGLKNNSGRLPAEDQNASVANHPYESRTRVFAVKGRCLNRLTNGCDEKACGWTCTNHLLTPREVYFYYTTHYVLRSVRKTNQAVPVYSASVRLGRYFKLYRNIRHFCISHGESVFTISCLFVDTRACVRHCSAN